MATIKSYTDIEQSHKLAEILPLESADMHSEAIEINGDMVFVVVCGLGDKTKPNYGSAIWSLAALLGVMICPNLEEYIEGVWDLTAFTDNTLKTPIEIQDCKDPVDACVAMIEKLHELKESRGEDKVEPKFKVGDWIVYNNNLYHIGNIALQRYYECLRIDGTVHTFDFEYIDSESHLWAIQDAKDGDVLCTYECGKPKIVFILKGAPKKPYVFGYHCYYNIMYPHFEFDSEKGCLAPNEEDVKPATKEQRDTLMKAIADAGYIFDFDKKKLKKN